MCELSYNVCSIYDVTYYSELECLLNRRFNKTGRAVCQVFTAQKEAVLNARMRKKELV
jgi:hypothetical protein